jgi:hypothetical protein
MNITNRIVARQLRQQRYPVRVVVSGIIKSIQIAKITGNRDLANKLYRTLPTVYKQREATQ